MFKKLVLTVLFILSIQTAFAQNNSLKIDLQSSGKLDSELVLNFVPTRRLEDGFSIELPPGMKSAIKSVSVNGKVLWLKENNTSPLKQNILHWQKTRMGYIILLSAGNLTAGTRIKINIQTPLIMNRQEDQRIALKEIKIRDNGVIDILREITGNLIPKPQDK